MQRTGKKQGPSSPVVADIDISCKRGVRWKKVGKRDFLGRYLAGVSGNPAGRPAGARNRAAALVPFLRMQLSALQAGVDCLVPRAADYNAVPGRVRSRVLVSAGQLFETYGHLVQLAGAGHLEMRDWERMSRDVVRAFDRLVEAEGMGD